MARLSVTGLDETLRQLDDVKERLQHITPALDEIGREIKTHIEERFHTRTAPDGREWLPVTLNTALYRDGDSLGLMRSRFASVRYRSIQYGAKASFAAVHQHGDGRVPARPFAPTDEDQGGPAEQLRERAKQALVRHVTGRR